MAIGESKKVYEPEDLLVMPEGNHCELVDGHLVEKKMGWAASLVATRLCLVLGNYVNDRKLGWVIVEGSYQCFPAEPKKVRIPDVSFIRTGRLAEPPQGHCPIVPDLVVEVTSPNDLYTDVEAKVQEYLHAGVPIVWIANPNTRTLQVLRPNRSESTRLSEHDTLTGEDVVPGFEIQVDELFKSAL